MPTLTVRTPSLEIAYDAYGDEAGFPLILLHGFPDDAHAWDTVAPPLAAAGYRALVPYLRGYGATRFLDDATYARATSSFDNPDFVPIVIHSYRHRHQNAPGDPRFDDIEKRLSERPLITAPSIVLHGADDTVSRPERSERDMAMFPAMVERRVVAHAGHFMPREQPQAVIDALLKLGEQERLLSDLH